MVESFRFGGSVCAGALLATLLAACGGGGDGSGSTPQADPPALTSGGGSSSGYYTVAESRSASPGPSSLLVVDPADPSHPKLTVTVDGQGSEFFRTTSAGTVDSVARTVRITGIPMLVYVKAGALYRVDLRADGAATPVRISSESHVCKIFDQHEVTTSGDDAWVEAQTAGVDNNCTTTTDNRTVLVRTSTPATTAGMPLPTTSTVVGTTSTAATPISNLLILEAAGATTKLRLYSTNMTPGNYVAGSDGARMVSPVYGFTFFGQSSRYYIVDNHLKLFTTDGTTANLSPALHTFTSPFTGALEAVVDASATYFVDDTKVMRVSGASAATQLATLAPSTYTPWIWQSPTHLVFSQDGRISAVPKSGGTVTTLKTGSTVSLINVSGSQVSYFLGTSLSLMGELRTINVDGNGDTLIEGGVTLAGHIGHSTHAFDGSTPFFKSMMYCVPRTGDTDCRRGTLKVMDGATHATTILGTFNAPSTLLHFSVDPVIGWDGFVTAVTTTAYATPTSRVSDAYLVSPNTPNSLVRVTTLAP